MNRSLVKPASQVSLVDRSEEEKSQYFQLCEKKRVAIKEYGEDHYWNNFDIVWGKKQTGKHGWVLICHFCGSSLSAQNVSANVKTHMQSNNVCASSNKRWNDHQVAFLGKRKRPITDADKEEVAQLKTKKKSNMTLDFTHHNSVLKRFMEGFQSWILMNNISISFACVEDPLLTESLKILGWPSGICRKTLSGSFLDRKFKEFLEGRQHYINHYKCFQIAADSWKSKYVNDANKLVGVTLNFPSGCQLGDIFTTSDEDTVSRAYLVTKMSNLIDGLGSDNYIGCVFDGELAYKNAGQELQRKYPGSIHLTCQAHSLSLLLKDISKIDKLKDCFSIAHKMVALCNVKECRTALRKYQIELYEKVLPMRLGLETRFGYFVTEMKDLQNSKRAIQKMAGDEKLLKKFNQDSVNSSTDDQRLAFSKIFSESFWSTLSTLTTSLGPIVEIIEHIEQDKPMMTQMYFIWRYLEHHFRVIELPAFELNGIPSFNGTQTRETLFAEDKEMALMVKKRKDYSNTDIFTLALLLDLRFYTQTGLNTFLPPVKQVSSTELAKARNALQALVTPEIWSDLVNEYDHLMEFGIEIRDEANVSALGSLISEYQSKVPGKDRWKMDESSTGNFSVSSLWRTIDHPRFPILSNDITRNIFALHVTSCSCERLWSRMRQLYKPTRHRLDPNRAKKLMMITLGRDFNRNHKNASAFLEGKATYSAIQEFGDSEDHGPHSQTIPLDFEVDDDTLDWLNNADLEFIHEEEIREIETVDLIEREDRETEEHQVSQENQTNFTP